MSRQVYIPSEVFERVVALRRDLHRHPELSWQEERTCSVVMEHLRGLGLEPRRLAGTGVVAEVPGAGGKGCVALRADLDALPISEETGLEFASQNDGVMHACGHDGHTAMLVGAAELLVAGPPPPAAVRLVWQPAEEVGAGAPALIADGVLEGVDMIFGGHVDRFLPAGILIISEGSVNGSTDLFTIDIRGKQGHSARPHEAIDAVVVGSLMVMAIQTIVSREMDPVHPSVISVGAFRAGDAPNVIAGSAHLKGTIRALDVCVRQGLRDAVERVATSVGRLHGADVEFRIQEGLPPVVNSAAMTDLGRAAARLVVGEEGVRPLLAVNLGGEDFACYLEHVPGFYARIGAGLPGREGVPNHSSTFDFDEDALAVGAAWFAAVAREAGARAG